MADNETDISLDASISVEASQAVSELNRISKTLSNVTNQVTGFSSQLDKAVMVIEGLATSTGKLLSQFSRSEIKQFSNEVAKMQNALNAAERIELEKQKFQDGVTQKNAESRRIEARNTTSKLALDKEKFKTGFTQKEQENRTKNAETQGRRVALAEEKFKTGITERDSLTRHQKAKVEEIRAATKWEQVKSGESKKALEIKAVQTDNESKRRNIEALRIEKGLEAKSLEIKATNAVVSLQKTEQGVYQREAETRQILAGTAEQRLANEAKRLELKEKSILDGTFAKEVETQGIRSQVSLGKLEQGVYQIEAETKARLVDTTIQQVQNESKSIAIKEKKVEDGLYAQELENQNLLAKVALEKARQGVFQTEAETKARLVDTNIQRAQNESVRLDITKQKLDEGLLQKEIDVKAVHANITLEKAQQGVFAQEAQNRAESLALNKAKFESGESRLELDVKKVASENRMAALQLAEKKLEEGITAQEVATKALNAELRRQELASGVAKQKAETASLNAETRSKEADIYQQKLNDGTVAKELEIRATNATVRLENTQKGVYEQQARNRAESLALEQSKFESGGYARELGIKEVANENRTLALQLADKKLEEGITSQEVEIRATNAQIRLNELVSGIAQQKADTASLNAEIRSQNADIYEQELAAGIIAQREHTKELDKINKSIELENRQRELDLGITERNSKTRELEAKNRAEKVRQEAELLEDRKATEQSKKKLYDARAARANDDYRYESGWRGGIASGIGGAISRARARSGFAGFAARVGTGVGQLHPEWNIMKGATLSGLGLNPLTLAFATVGAGIAKLTEGLGKLGTESLQAYGEVEKLKTGLSVVFGSDTEANTMFEGIKEYSLASPFGVEQTTEMATLLKQSGIYGTELLDTMKMIGDTAGGNEEKFRRIANNYAQIASIGKASMLDMRQFAYAGIPIYKKVAEELGVSQSVLRQMISDGEVTNEVIEKVFKTMTSEGGEFYKAVERGAETLNARLVNLKDSMNMAKAGIGEWLFKLDIVGIGNSSDNQGSLGHLLNFVEELARKADDWATLRNIERDVNAISTRETVSSELQDAIRQAALSGEDTAVLQSLYNKVSGMDTLESTRDTYTQYNKYYEDIANRATTENFNNLQRQLEAVEGMSTTGKSTEFKEWKKSTKKALEEEIDFIKDYLPVYQETQRQLVPGSGVKEVVVDMVGKKFLELQDALAITGPYVQQTKAQELSTRMFERGQKTAAASTSLTSFAEQSRQKYLETEQGKAELEAKERAEYEKYTKRFNSLRPLVDDTGNIIDDMRINIGQFVELMESGLIEPLEKVSVTWDALAVNTSDTTSQARDKVDTWQGMASRADDISHLLYILPMELQDSFRSIFDVLDKKDMNTKENVTELNKYMSDLENSQMFNANKNAQNLLQYLLTSNASVLSKIYSYDELKGKGEDNIPLWKRITGSALGVDPSFITNAKDFHELYGREFVGRNISQGVISGMVSSGRSTREISNRLRFTGQRAQDGTLLIDWERTADSMAMFATSTNASLVEMNAYKDALRAQIDTYGKLKETMFTVGEDWEKLDSKRLEEQLYNAFSGIDGAKMVATNLAGDQRELAFNADDELVFKDTGELYAAQQEFMFSMEESANALDKFSSSLLNAYQRISLDTITQETIQSKGMQIVSDSVSGYSAKMFLEGKTQTPDTLLNALGPQIDTLLKEQTEKPDEYNQRFSKDNIDALKLSMGGFLTSFTDEDLRNIDFVKANLERAKDVQKEYGDFSASGGINEGTEAGIFVDAIKKYTDVMLAASVQLDKEGNTVGSEQEIANLLEIKALLQPDLIDIVDKQLYTARTAQGREDFARQVSPARFYQSAKEDVEKNVRKQLGLSEDDKLPASAQMLYDRFMALADSLGVVDVNLENFKETLQYDYEKQYSEAKSSGDLAGTAQANLEKALNDLASAKTGMEKAGAIGDFTGSKFQELGANLIQGTDVGAFAQGAAMGGPIVGLINMLVNALGNVIGGMEILGYALSPVTNLLQGLGPILKILMVPLVAISRGFEMVGEMFAGLFDNELMKGIDDWFDSLTGRSDEEEELAARLEKLNEILGRTTQTMKEAEEYYLVQNRQLNAYWAAQQQGNIVMDSRKVNDMILTPHGNFSTAPDDYLIAMKDPASLLGMGGGQGYVKVNFIVNNNVSDMVEATTTEQIDEKGIKSLIVTISKVVARDYETGKNGWESAIGSRENRSRARSITR